MVLGKKRRPAEAEIRPLKRQILESNPMKIQNPSRIMQNSFGLNDDKSTVLSI